jgi:hypothetical protein
MALKTERHFFYLQIMDSIQAYIDTIPEEKEVNFLALLNAIRNSVPNGFEETINYNMIGFVVPHSKYPPGYHCDPKLPLPFINIAAQKSHLALYHMGIYAFPEIHDWFVSEYQKGMGKKPNMGKSCIRFTYKQKLPLKLIEELCSKITPDEWIEKYESAIKR